MAAVGLMALAKTTSDYDLAGSARSKYTEAVHMVNSALQSPERSRDDTTLMSVISLGVFEEISDYKSWVLHVQGAAALLVARGRGQFSSSISLKLFNQVRTDLITACVNEDKPVPDEILRLQEAGSAHPEASGSFWRIGMLGVRCAQLLTKFKGYSIGLATHLLAESDVLQHDFVTAGQSLMLEEPYSTIHDVAGHPDLVCGGKIGAYSDVWSIRIWNNWRNLLMIVCRIKCFLLNEVLKHALGPDSVNHLKVERHGTLQLLSQLGEDILATAPQVTAFQVGGSPGKGEQDVAPALSHVAGAYLLAGRFSIVGQSEATSRETRQWIIKRLQHISDTARIPTAVKIIQDIEAAEA
ncbi:hypothetical protein NLG97_g2844 [Lecanicillium saksenae]|uniref:Uncharacterized protein n=1 Tax=Lecanicillium saksenae TaxID=468837 RepID=A0ACC1R3T8_9HYPO|nr:hypothetical protein NLG97_g2844 [Lecanicillium saksenae]